MEDEHKFVRKNMERIRLELNQKKMNAKEQNKDSVELTSENFSDVPSEGTLKQSFNNLELAFGSFLKLFIETFVLPIANGFKHFK